VRSIAKKIETNEQLVIENRPSEAFGQRPQQQSSTARQLMQRMIAGLGVETTIQRRPRSMRVYALVKLLNKVMLLEGGGVKVEKASKAA
jgi:hypothetical protein